MSEPRGAGDGLGYHEIHRGGANSWWRSLLGVVLLLLLGVVVVPLVLQVAVLVAMLAEGSTDLQGDFDRFIDLSNPTPASLAYLNVSLAALIPIVFLAQWLLHRLRPGWLTSVFGRMRWKYFLACLGLACVALFATIVVSTLMPAEQAGEPTGGINDLTEQSLYFGLVVLFLTPLQAAGEEYAFRGYLTQVFGGHFPTAVAVVGPALLFAFAHGAQDPPIFVDRLAFGLVAGILVVCTGGLEAGIAMHVLNNWLAFGLALLFGDMGSALNPTGGTWWSIPVTLTQSLVYLGLALWVAREMGIARRTEPAVLAPRGGSR